MLVAAWAGSKFSGWENEKLQDKKSSTDAEVEQLCRAFESATFNADEVPGFVPVPSVTKLKEWKEVCDQMEHANLMVCGPRGVGKTTLVKSLLRGERGMMHIPLEPCSVDHFYWSILEVLQCKFEGIPPKALVKRSLSHIHKKGGRKPTIVVEVNEKCDARQMMQLLVEIKTVGTDFDCKGRYFKCLRGMTDESRKDVLQQVKKGELSLAEMTTTCNYIKKMSEINSLS